MRKNSIDKKDLIQSQTKEEIVASVTGQPEECLNSDANQNFALNWKIQKYHLT